MTNWVRKILLLGMQVWGKFSAILFWFLENTQYEKVICRLSHDIHMYVCKYFLYIKEKDKRLSAKCIKEWCEQMRYSWLSLCLPTSVCVWKKDIYRRVRVRERHTQTQRERERERLNVIFIFWRERERERVIGVRVYSIHPCVQACMYVSECVSVYLSPWKIHEYFRIK